MTTLNKVWLGNCLWRCGVEQEQIWCGVVKAKVLNMGSSGMIGLRW